MCPQYGATPVYVAASEDNPKCLQVLIAAKADLNIANKVSARGSWRWRVLEWVCVQRARGVGKAIGVLALMQWWYTLTPSCPPTLLPSYLIP